MTGNVTEDGDFVLKNDSGVERVRLSFSRKGSLVVTISGTGAFDSFVLVADRKEAEAMRGWLREVTER